MPIQCTSLILMPCTCKRCLTKRLSPLATFHLLIHLCTIQALDRNILVPETFQMLLYQDNFIDRVNLCWNYQLMPNTTRISLYSQTIHAFNHRMRDRRWVEFYYHGSSGTEGDSSKKINPGCQGILRPQWLLNLGLKVPAP